MRGSSFERRLRALEAKVDEGLIFRHVVTWEPSYETEEQGRARYTAETGKRILPGEKIILVKIHRSPEDVEQNRVKFEKRRSAIK